MHDGCRAAPPRSRIAATCLEEGGLSLGPPLRSWGCATIELLCAESELLLASASRGGTRDGERRDARQRWPGQPTANSCAASADGGHLLAHGLGGYDAARSTPLPVPCCARPWTSPSLGDPESRVNRSEQLLMVVCPINGGFFVLRALSPRRPMSDPSPSIPAESLLLGIGRTPHGELTQDRVSANYRPYLKSRA